MKLFFTAVLMFSCIFCNAQTSTVSGILEQQLTLQPQYTISPAFNEKYFSIPCAFGKSDLQFPEPAINADSIQVTAIDLVFTDYPSADPLTALNTARMQQLLAQYPSLINNNSIAWQVVRQTNGAEKANAEKLFHGFVIYYRPKQSKATAAADILHLKDILTPEVITEAKRNGFVTADTTELRKQYEIEEYTTVLKMPVADALRYMHIDMSEKITYKNYDSLYIYLKPTTDSTKTSTLKAPEDSTVLKVFDRMHWNKMLVVSDVTASMYPYIGQLLVWLKFHEDERRIDQFVFFNDGDDIDDDKKRTGFTGGIYSTNSSVFDVVEQLAFKAMGNGNGGNIPENNIEALLKGQALCSNCTATIMIADNASPVSDMSLLAQLQHPVHIIVCGVRGVVNSDYLSIARATGGSVHTAEEDIQQLAALKEGDSISIHGKRYVIKTGKFVVGK